MPVTFTCRDLPAVGSRRRTEFRCNETGVCYQLESTADGYIIYNSGNAVAHRTERQMGVTFIEQLAELDFRTAQAEGASS